MPCKAVIEDFYIHVRDVLELEEEFRIFPLEECASNVLLLISDGERKFVIKKYISKCYFNTELFFLLQCSDLNLKTPDVLYFEDNKQYGWNWILYKYIEGTSLFNLNLYLNANELSLVFFELGQMLFRFHHIKRSNSFVFFDKNKYVDQIIDRTELNYSMLGNRKTLDIFKCVICFLRSNYCLLQVVDNYSFIIKDFTAKHIILFNQAGRWEINGVIDFEMVCFSNKYYDFVMLYVDYLLNNKMLENSFLRGYSINIGNDEKKLIAFFVLQYAIELCSILKDNHPDNEKNGELIIVKVFSWLEEIHNI